MSRGARQPTACRSSRSIPASSTVPARRPKAISSAADARSSRRRLPGVDRRRAAAGRLRTWTTWRGAHVAALTATEPATRYVVGGENAPQRAIFDYLARARQPAACRGAYPTRVATAVPRSSRRRAPRSFVARRSLTRGVVEIFRHDWSLDSDWRARELGLTITPLDDGLERTLASLRLIRCSLFLQPCVRAVPAKSSHRHHDLSLLRRRHRRAARNPGSVHRGAERRDYAHARAPGARSGRRPTRRLAPSRGAGPHPDIVPRERFAGACRVVIHAAQSSGLPGDLTADRNSRLITRMPQTDAAAVALARDGDSEAFRALVERHSRAVYRLAHRMTGSPQDAEDVVQETFLRAYRQLGRFESRANFGTWLHRIAVNCSIDLIRSRRHQEAGHDAADLEHFEAAADDRGRSIAGAPDVEHRSAGAGRRARWSR